MATESNPTDSRSLWGGTSFPASSSTILLSIAALVLAIINRAGSGWETIGNIAGGLEVLTWVLAVLVLIIGMFAIIRRQDPDNGRFVGVAASGQWMIIFSLVITIVASAINP